MLESSYLISENRCCSQFGILFQLKVQEAQGVEELPNKYNKQQFANFEIFTASFVLRQISSLKRENVVSKRSMLLLLGNCVISVICLLGKKIKCSTRQKIYIYWNYINHGLGVTMSR